MRNYLLNRRFVLAMAVWILCLSALPSNAAALPSESLTVVELGSMREAQMLRILQVLSHPQAKLHLLTAGIGEKDVRDALAKLDDVELAALSQKAEAVKAGGDALGVLAGVLAIVLLVMLIFYLMEKQIIVKDKEK